jgi:hypothetical protein
VSSAGGTAEIAVSTLELSGHETNVWYRELDDGSVETVGSTTGVAGEVGHMESDVVHAVEHRCSERPLSLSLCHGDLLNVDVEHRRIEPPSVNQEEYDLTTVGLPE